jgi:DNA-binding PadR family transcriptional regulator
MLFCSMLQKSMAPPTSNSAASDLLPVTPLAFSILVALIEGDLHGYGIAKRIADRQTGAVTLAPGNLYAALDRLIASGLIEARPKRRDDRKRLYGITPFGREVAALEAARLDELVRTARRLALLPSGRGGRS